MAAQPGLSATRRYGCNGEKGVSGVLAAIPQAILFALAQSDHMAELPQLYALIVPDVPENACAGPSLEIAGYLRRALCDPLSYHRTHCGSSASG
ncbi:hypothetical protein ACW2Q0_01380 [Nocardia sp. R16R-3T]